MILIKNRLKLKQESQKIPLIKAMRQRMLFLTMLVLPMMAVQAQVAEEDSLALVALYNATDGANWTGTTNWLMGPVSQWMGVEVTGNRVTGLDLHNNQLTRSIPPELGGLTKLEILDLQSNQLTGAIPPELGGLTKLRFLILSSNQFTGSIPPELGDLTDLRVLWLYNNQLTESIPPELGDLINLTELYLYENQLTGSIPPELGGLTKLRFLILYENQLTGSIPPELGDLTDLRTLWLYNNQLTESIPPELGDLINLTELYLYNNPLSGTLPLSLTNLSMLDTFWFNDTTLCEPIDEAFQAWLQGIGDVRSTGCTNVAREEAAEILTGFALNRNYPNPFNPQTTIQYGLPQAASVHLVVYDTVGRRVRILIDEQQSSGWHQVVFEASNLPSGVYFYRLEADSFQETGQMLLVK